MDLVELMNKVLADTFVMYLKAQSFHWNVEGSDFKQYHDFFGDVYGEVYGAVDPMAEQIRALDGYAAGTLVRFQALTSIKETVTVQPARDMLYDLQNANEKVLEILKETQLNADRQGEIGLSNFLQDRYDAHKKHGWMIRSFLKTRPTDE